MERVGAVTGWTVLGGPIAGDAVLATQGARTALAARFADGTLRPREANGGIWGGWRELAEGICAMVERRTARLWQVAQPFVAPPGFDHPRILSGARVTVPLVDLDTIAKKRSIALTDGRAAHVVSERLRRDNDCSHQGVDRKPMFGLGEKQCYFARISCFSRVSLCFTSVGRRALP